MIIDPNMVALSIATAKHMSSQTPEQKAFFNLVVEFQKKARNRRDRRTAYHRALRELGGKKRIKGATK